MIDKCYVSYIINGQREREFFNGETKGLTANEIIEYFKSYLIDCAIQNSGIYIEDIQEYEDELIIKYISKNVRSLGTQTDIYCNFVVEAA